MGRGAISDCRGVLASALPRGAASALTHRVGADDGLAAAGAVDLVDDGYVVAGAAVDHVAPRVNAEDVVVADAGEDVVAARAGGDAVIAGAAEQTVVARATDQAVAASAAEEDVVAGFAEQPVVACAHQHPVAAGAGTDQVAAPTGADAVIPRAGDDHVGLRRAGEPVRARATEDRRRPPGATTQAIARQLDPPDRVVPGVGEPQRAVRPGRDPLGPLMPGPV